MYMLVMEINIYLLLWLFNIIVFDTYFLLSSIVSSLIAHNADVKFSNTSGKNRWLIY